MIHSGKLRIIKKNWCQCVIGYLRNSNYKSSVTLMILKIATRLDKVLEFVRPVLSPVFSKNFTFSTITWFDQYKNGFQWNIADTIWNFHQFVSLFVRDWILGNHPSRCLRNDHRLNIMSICHILCLWERHIPIWNTTLLRNANKCSLYLYLLTDLS